MVEQGAAPAGGDKRSHRARAVPGPRPEALEHVPIICTHSLHAGSS